MTKIHDVRQGSDESPAAFLEQLIEAFLQYTPYDPSSEEHKATVTMAFIDQASRDIREKASETRETKGYIIEGFSASC